MLAFAASMILAAANPIEPLEAQDVADASEIELVLEETLESGFDSDEIVFDDTLLNDADNELLEIEE